jgi:hypothetical protein
VLCGRHALPLSTRILELADGSKTAGMKHTLPVSHFDLVDFLQVRQVSPLAGQFSGRVLN